MMNNEVHVTRPGTLADLLPLDCERRTAVVVPDGGPQLTYAELREWIGALADALSRDGIQAGDRVAIVLPNGLEFLAVFLAVTSVGAIAAPLNPVFTAEEYRSYLAVLRAGTAIVGPEAQAARDAAAALRLFVCEAHLSAGTEVRLEVLSGRRVPYY